MHLFEIIRFRKTFSLAALAVQFCVSASAIAQDTDGTLEKP